MRHSLAIFFILILVLLSSKNYLLSNSTNETYQWQSVPIGGGGYVTGIVFHPNEKNLIYARTDVGGSYRWHQETNVWIPLNDAVNRENSSDTGALSIALDPTNANRVYIMAGLYIQEWAGEGALLISKDKGNSWVRVKLPFKVGGNENARGAGERLMVDPNLPSRLFLGSNKQGLWRSEDYGKSWSKIQTFQPQQVLFVLFDPTSSKLGKASKIIYAAAVDHKNSLYKSIDAGITWTPVSDQPTNILFRRASLTNNTLYLSGGNNVGPNGMTDGGVWALETNKNIWRDISPPKGQGGFGGICVDPSEPNRIIVSTFNRWYPRNEIYLSEDRGLSWIPILSNSQLKPGKSPYVKHHIPHWITDIKIDPFNHERAMFVTGYGIYETTNLGSSKPITWTFQNEGLEETVILELISPPEGAHLLSAMGDLDGFKHNDVYSSPSSGRLKPEFGSNNSITFAAKKPNLMARTIERGDKVHCAWSDNAGDSWSRCMNEPEGAHAGQVALSSDGKVILWTPKNMNTYYTFDRGITWIKSTGLPNNLKPIADSVKPMNFYAYNAKEGKVYLSRDYGKSFSEVSDKLPTLPFWFAGNGNIRAVPGQSGHVFITTGKELYFSEKEGYLAKALSGVEESYLITFGRGRYNDSYPSIYLYGKVNDVVGFYRSDNKGSTWIRINDHKHQFGKPICLSGDPRVYGRLYVGTAGRGIIMAEFK